MRPFFYPDNDVKMKYSLSTSNFKVYYETYLNPLHPYYNGGGLNPIWANLHQCFPTSGLNIFDYAMIVDRTTRRPIKDNKKITPGNT